MTYSEGMSHTLGILVTNGKDITTTLTFPLDTLTSQSMPFISIDSCAIGLVINKTYSYRIFYLLFIFFFQPSLRLKQYETEKGDCQSHLHIAAF